ncbi:MAG: hypothetical protein P1R58_12475 [bacterium]|nr:hypothetical protein [bacterium]
MNRSLYSVLAALLLLLMAVPAALAAEDYSVVVLEPSLLTDGPGAPPPLPTADGDKASYTGTIKLHIVEPTSRWRDENNHTYEFGLLDYALVQGFTVADGATWEAETTWNSILNGMGSIAENNIMVQAVVFNPTPMSGYSDPPTGSPFTAYYTDAAAEAIVGVPGYNSTAAGHTHTVFVEEGTASW